MLFFFGLPEDIILILVGAEQSNGELKGPMVCCVPNAVSLIAFGYNSFCT